MLPRILAQARPKLLVYVYVATHGIMYAGATKTKIVLNEVEISKRYYNLQCRLDYLASENRNVYFIAVFDCFRNRVDRPRTMGNEGSVSDEHIVVRVVKARSFYIFSCISGGQTSDDTQLSECIEQVNTE